MNYNLRRFIFLFIAILIALPSSYAVLKESSLSRTLGVLKNELENDARDLQKILERHKAQHLEMHNQLIDYMKRCEQIGLMLYSQKIGWMTMALLLLQQWCGQLHCLVFGLFFYSTQN